MALTEFQRTVCRLIADQRIRSGESYVAGGTALNTWTRSSRISRDIDLFHDTTEAVASSWAEDRKLLEDEGYNIAVVHERFSYVEAVIAKEGGSVLMQWAPDSAYRFFPLVLHDDFGLTLHPFDLATNKVLALIGRLEARDWVDLIACHDRIQRLGFLVWAACSKDPGFSPASILEQAGRSGRYTAPELAELSFEGPPPDAAELSRKWHGMLEEAKEIVAALPTEEVGKCVLDSGGELFAGHPGELAAALDAGTLLFHPGRIRGAMPQVKGG
jgi:hypothetical protein